MKSTASTLVCVLLACCMQACVEKHADDEYLSDPFVHPGMAQSSSDLEYMRKQVLDGKEPWKLAFENLQEKSDLDFEPKAVAEISVGPYGANSIGGLEFSESAEAAYCHALMWYITGRKEYADKSAEIMNAWSSRLRAFDANNAKLNVGLFGYYFLNAAEILKHTDSGWSKDDIDKFTRMVLTVFYPTIKDFFTEANGNWDASMINTMMCIGVFTDNHDIFNRAVERFYRGEGNSGITKYIYPGGQCQETTRDWDHVQLGLGEMARAAQTADTQGLDFYSVADDRIAQGFEYASRFLTGGSIELYGVFTDRQKDRFKDVFESVYHYYRQSKGIRLPYTEKVIMQHTRPASSFGLLAAIKAPGRNSPTQLTDFVPYNDFLSPTVAGALEKVPESLPEDRITVAPGSSIQEALDAARNTGRWVVLEAGVHTLESPLILYSGTRIAGHGRSTIIFPKPSLNTAIINGEPVMSNVIIKDLLLEGAVRVVENADPNHDRRSRSYMNAPSREGIILKSTEPGGISSFTMENVTVQNFTKNGVAIVGAEDIHIIRCNFSDNGGSVVPGAGFHHNIHISYAENVEIVQSRFDTSTFGNGVNLTFCNEVCITGSEMARNGLSGVHCAESRRITIEDCLMEGNDLYGAFIEKQMYPCEQIAMRRNLLQNNRHGGMKADEVSKFTDEHNRELHNSD